MCQGGFVSLRAALTAPGRVRALVLGRDGWYAGGTSSTRGGRRMIWGSWPGRSGA